MSNVKVVRSRGTVFVDMSRTATVFVVCGFVEVGECGCGWRGGVEGTVHFLVVWFVLRVWGMVEFTYRLLCFGHWRSGNC